jgi:hypothetical protein
MVARVRIQHGQRQGELFTPMHWNHALRVRGRLTRWWPGVRPAFRAAGKQTNGGAHNRLAARLAG